MRIAATPIISSLHPDGDAAANERRERAEFTQVQAADPADEIPRLQTYLLRSAILPDDRNVFIYLPEQYETEPLRRFPVLYLHDGQNLFDPRLSYIPGRTWRAGSTADLLNQQGRAEPMILVGIANTGLRRMAEYTPTRDFRMGGGDGSLYGRLLTEELKPFVDGNFRTRPEAEATGLAGSSLGGLITLYLGLQHSDVFSRLGVISPSIWWDHRSILKMVGNAKVAPEDLRLWLDIGTGEGMRHVRDCEFLYRQLINQGWKPDVNLKFIEFAGAVHDEDAWAHRFDQVLCFLFPARV